MAPDAPVGDKTDVATANGAITGLTARTLAPYGRGTEEIPRDSAPSRMPWVMLCVLVLAGVVGVVVAIHAGNGATPNSATT